MFLSRVTLDLNKLTPTMHQKWLEAQPYASHQWLWQLFPGQQARTFLFRHEPFRAGACFYLLSEGIPQAEHAFLTVETKPFAPQLCAGMTLHFALRANPVITRQGKRSDVLMDAKYQAKLQGVDPAEYWSRQVAAAKHWLKMQGEAKGFTVNQDDLDVIGQQQQRFVRKSGQAAVTFTSVDFAGRLLVTDATQFLETLRSGIGKSKGLGCGLMLIRRG
ncbi:type I-E CRISPR-associated protein Cas6/Cse3/CasE [Enterobacter sp. ENT03]|uniref:type I-E CRISPR-associated protein Cas6/Cse3/CasE n=1 Tax=Enterobacter sp. ENT03 TaxID=2854780 RepID=UPI001C436B8A|nr:type I-E CRISPR-associated protein Cas6/Cse3/CasE [Enterobacter sp. ENT03]MBV7404214.1 type I-E CRISPR-associated protein Cas6/Cse3/CasE [Enterobacter sp. ENT03]